MKFECPNCKKSGAIDDSEVPDDGMYANCPDCQTKFLIKRANNDFAFEPVQPEIKQTPTIQSYTIPYDAAKLASASNNVEPEFIISVDNMDVYNNHIKIKNVKVPMQNIIEIESYAYDLKVNLMYRRRTSWLKIMCKESNLMFETKCTSVHFSAKAHKKIRSAANYLQNATLMQRVDYLMNIFKIDGNIFVGNHNPPQAFGFDLWKKYPVTLHSDLSVESNGAIVNLNKCRRDGIFEIGTDTFYGNTPYDIVLSESKRTLGFKSKETIQFTSTNDAVRALIDTLSR